MEIAAKAAAKTNRLMTSPPGSRSRLQGGPAVSQNPYAPAALHAFSCSVAKAQQADRDNQAPAGSVAYACYLGWSGELSFLRRPTISFGAGAAHQHCPVAVA